MADPAPSEEPSPPADKAAAGDAQGPPAPKVDGKAFANTKKHVADQQVGDAAIERFANTKLNIALINDPKNGPRFTMTKRESGLADEEADETTSNDPEGTDADQAKTAKDAKTETAPDPEKADSTSDAPDADKIAADKPTPAAGTTDAVKTDEPASAAGPADKGGQPPGTPPAEETPDKVQIDSTKIFVGHNGTYYDESWRWMDWRGTRRSWNWPAALSFGQWFAYRRLHRYAGLHALLLAGLAAAAVNDVPILALIALVFLAVGLSGVYANTLYFSEFRRAVDHVTKTGEGSYRELQGQLAAAGGTSLPALAVTGALTIAGIGAALAVTHRVRGGFSLNFWPF